MQERWQQVDRLFAEAIRLPAEDRAAFLMSACPDSGIRADLLSLLTAHVEADGFLESLADSVVAPAMARPEREPLPPDPLQLEGRSVGRYDVEECLGHGGMGVIYRAQDRLLGRTVALKFLSPHLAASEEAERRFIWEARAASSLDHPNIAAIYEVGEAASEAGSRRYIAMTFCEGGTLKDRIVHGPLPVEDALSIALQVARGLAHAHEVDIIHRDIKPANVMVAPDGRVRLVDFGLVKALGASRLTATGRQLGTAAYMSPEQARTEDVDARSDLWSLGVILFEMLTGVRPFDGEREISIVYAILHRPPPPVSALRHDLPAGVDAVLQQCLRRDAGTRYQRAEQLVEDLEALLRGDQPIHATPVGTTAVSGPAVAVLPFETIGADNPTAFTRGIHADVITRLSSADDLQVISRTTMDRYWRSGKSIPEMGSELDAGWVVEGDVREAGSRVQVNARLINARTDRQVWASNYVRDLTPGSIFEIQAEVTDAIADALQGHLLPHRGLRIGRVPTDNLVAYRLHAQGRRSLDQRTESGIRKARSCFQQAIDEDPSYALAWVGLADSLALLHDYGHEVTEEIVAQAEAAARRALEIDPDLAEAQASLALVHSNRREGPEAVELLKRAVELRPSYAEAHNWLSWVYQLIGEKELALSSARQAVRLDPLSLEAIYNLTFSLLINGHLIEALQEARRGWDIDPDLETGPLGVGMALLHLGRHEEARDVLAGVSVPWAGKGAELTRALACLALGEEDEVDHYVSDFERGGHWFASGVLKAARGAPDEGFADFSRIRKPDYWTVFTTHFFYPEELAALRADPRFASLKQLVRRAWNLNSTDAPRITTAPEGGNVGNNDSGLLAVLPFERGSEELDESMVDGLHHGLTAGFSALRTLQVIARASTGGAEVDDPAAVTRALGADWLLAGTVNRAKDRVLVDVRLYGAVRRDTILETSIERPLTAPDLFDLQSEIVRQVADALSRSLTPAERSRLNRAPTGSGEAYLHYVHGRAQLHERTEEAMREALGHFQRAVEIDPDFAAGWSGLADVIGMLGSYYGHALPPDIPDGLDAARRAVELDPDLGEAHASLGIARSLRYDSPGALAALKRAIELQPSHAEAYVWLAWVHLLTGDPQASLEPARQAVALNPLSPPYRVFLAESLLAVSEEEDALRQARRAREIQPSYALAHFFEALALHHLGQFDRAIAALETASEVTENVLGSPRPDEVRALAAAAHSRQGDYERVRALESELRDGDDAFAHGIALAALGDHDGALEAFNRVERWQSFAVEFLRYFLPDVLGPVRSDTRYEEVLARIGETWRTSG